MAYATIKACDAGTVLGRFVEKQYGHTFEFALRSEEDRARFMPDLPHDVFVGPCSETRAGHVKVTMAKIATDENVIEVWQIKNKKLYRGA